MQTRRPEPVPGTVIPFPRPGSRGLRTKLADLSVTFDDVWFGYEAGYPALKGVGFDIGGGRMLALAGHAGAGKRSCARLLQRLWDVERGAVRIGGVDLRALSPAAVRDLVTMVPRHCALRPETVADNLRLARPGVTMVDMAEAARSAQVHEAIMRLPLGYDTPFEAWSQMLSAGERQRIALAGAVLGEAPILILDETASLLGPADEQAWLAAVARVQRGRTILLISSRLATLRMADAIVVMEQGAVAEEGRHDHLVTWNDRYADLIASGILT